MAEVIEDKGYYMERVCELCPGSLWGTKSICRIHDKPIGNMDWCQEWDKMPAPAEFKEHKGQLALFDIEPALEVIQMVEEDLSNYKWMINEINRIKKYLNSVTTSGDLMGSSGVAQYGIEASLPKGKGLKLAGITIPLEKYEKTLKRLQKYESKVKQLDDVTEKLHDEKQRMVLICILEGEKMKDIAISLKVSRQRLNEIRREIVKRIAWELYEEELKGA